MRINKYLAQATGMSRRAADKAIEAGRVGINGSPAQFGTDVATSDSVTFDGRVITPDVKTVTIMLNKPVGYVVSRDGQGSRTIYDLLPSELHHLKPVGRLDKDSSGLLLLTNDGDLTQALTHPSNRKLKIYEVMINKPLAKKDFDIICSSGVDIGDDRPSRLQLKELDTSKQKQSSPNLVLHSYFLVSMHEGRNRQIRRTFAALGYDVIKLHRTHFGDYSLPTALGAGHWQ